MTEISDAIRKYATQTQKLRDTLTASPLTEATTGEAEIAKELVLYLPRQVQLYQYIAAQVGGTPIAGVQPSSIPPEP